MSFPYKWLVSFLVDLGYMIELLIIVEEKIHFFKRDITLQPMITKDIKISKASKTAKLAIVVKLKKISSSSVKKVIWSRKHAQPGVDRLLFDFSDIALRDLLNELFLHYSIQHVIGVIPRSQLPNLPAQGIYTKKKLAHVLYFTKNRLVYQKTTRSHDSMKVIRYFSTGKEDFLILIAEIWLWYTLNLEGYKGSLQIKLRKHCSLQKIHRKTSSTNNVLDSPEDTCISL